MSVKIKLVNNKEQEGELFSLDVRSKTLTLKKADGTVVVINADHIQNVTGKIAGFKPDLQALGISAHEVDRQEDTAFNTASKLINNTNFEVSNEIQSLFEKINIMYSSTVWKNNSIQIMDEYIIDPPYTNVTVLPNKDGLALDRMQKIVS